MIAVRVSPELESRINSLAKRTHRSKAFYIREALENYLSDIEDYYDAVKVSGQISSGKMKTYTLDEVEKNLGIHD